MLGKPYFTLVRALDDAKSFEAVCDLLSNHLPRIVGADDVFVMEYTRDAQVAGLHGSGPIAKVMREKADLLEELLPEHPLTHRINWENPGVMGLAVSDFMDPADYARHPFNFHIKGEIDSADGLSGRLFTSYRRLTMLTACRVGGAFKAGERENFDAVLFFARSILERISGANPEIQVRRFLLSRQEAVALFSVSPKGEVLPINFLALRFAESWWGQDEAFHNLGDEIDAKLREELEVAWKDPVVAEMHPTEVDLGGGPVSLHALAKPTGEILLMVPQTTGPKSDGDPVDAILTKRQHEIMEWIAEGKTSAEVAIILSISPRTVEKHLEAVFQRLGVENRIGAVRRYLDLKAGHPL